MNEIASQLLALLIVLIGFGIIVSLFLGGSEGPKKFLGCLLLPFKFLTWALIIGLVFLVGLAFLFSMLAGIGRSGGAGSSNNPSSIPPPQPWQNPVTLLDRYAPLSQLNPAIYSSATFAETMDGGMPVKKLSCLATSYLMIVRAHGSPLAVIGPDRPDSGAGVQYTIGSGAIQPPGDAFDRVAYDAGKVIEEITRHSRPVILRAEAAQGSDVLTHYVLAVGYDRDARRILYNDPWFDDDSGNRPGFSANDPNPALQRLPSYKVRGMHVATQMP